MAFRHQAPSADLACERDVASFGSARNSSNMSIVSPFPAAEACGLSSWSPAALAAIGCVPTWVQVLLLDRSLNAQSGWTWIGVFVAVANAAAVAAEAYERIILWQSLPFAKAIACFCARETTTDMMGKTVFLLTVWWRASRSLMVPPGDPVGTDEDEDAEMIDRCTCKVRDALTVGLLLAAFVGVFNVWGMATFVLNFWLWFALPTALALVWTLHAALHQRRAPALGAVVSAVSRSFNTFDSDRRGVDRLEAGLLYPPEIHALGLPLHAARLAGKAICRAACCRTVVRLFMRRRRWGPR